MRWWTSSTWRRSLLGAEYTEAHSLHAKDSGRRPWTAMTWRRSLPGPANAAPHSSHSASSERCPWTATTWRRSLVATANTASHSAHLKSSGRPPWTATTCFLSLSILAKVLGHWVHACGRVSSWASSAWLSSLAVSANTEGQCGQRCAPISTRTESLRALRSVRASSEVAGFKKKSRPLEVVPAGRVGLATGAEDKGRSADMVRGMGPWSGRRVGQ
mmetsp:Transcript_16397/g.43975  ORF Transcript_16397/g.43975 Transcript_16397/m.43975 type:complete len:216 (+) Transcript_16397:859-1506(+)